MLSQLEWLPVEVVVELNQRKGKEQWFELRSKKYNI